MYSLSRVTLLVFFLLILKHLALPRFSITTPVSRISSHKNNYTNVNSISLPLLMPPFSFHQFKSLMSSCTSYRFYPTSLSLISRISSTKDNHTPATSNSLTLLMLFLLISLNLKSNVILYVLWLYIYPTSLSPSSCISSTKDNHAQVTSDSLPLLMLFLLISP